MKSGNAQQIEIENDSVSPTSTSPLVFLLSWILETSFNILWIYFSVLRLGVAMAKDELLTDDYVASLLAKDAKESSIKYSALGLEAFSSQSK